jgi:lyso-ornithine lipid O-acyltransferase
MDIRPLGDLRFGARTAVFAAYTLGTLGVFEVQARGADAATTEALIASKLRRYGRDMCRLFGVDVDVVGTGEGNFVHGRGSDGLGRMFVSNHRSALDILVTLALLEGKHLSRADLATWPVVGVVARRAGILFVDRENRRAAAAAVHEMIQCIERGIGVIVFPEGTTYAGDEVRPFKPGALAVARRTGCEVVPVGIAYGGSATSFDDETFLAHMRRVAGQGTTRVAISVGEPFRAEGNDSPALSKRAQDAVQALVHRSRARLV